jgi:hypothetical protein
MTRRPPNQTHEWRVTYRRSTWGETTSNQVRMFQRRHAARAFVRRLRSDDRPDLGAIVVLEVHRREVGEWTPLRIRDDR